MRQARLIASLPGYCCQENGENVTIHQHLGGTVALEHASFTLSRQYPWDGNQTWRIQAQRDLTVCLRIPGWAGQASVLLNGQPITSPAEQGYMHLNVPSGESELRLTLDMKPQRWHAHPAVRQDAGCVAFTFGPLVYCFECVDNPEPLCALRVGRDAAVMSAYDPGLLGGIRTLCVQGERMLSPDGALYTRQPYRAEPVVLKGIPYYVWANREAKDMRVWLPEQECAEDKA